MNYLLTEYISDPKLRKVRETADTLQEAIWRANEIAVFGDVPVGIWLWDELHEVWWLQGVVTLEGKYCWTGRPEALRWRPTTA